WRLPAVAFSLAYDLSGKWLAVGYQKTSVAVSVFDSTTSALVTELAVGPVGNQVVAWNPDGNRLAVASTDPSTQIWDVARRRRVAILEGHIQDVSYVTFHPRGELVATESIDGTVR